MSGGRVREGAGGTVVHRGHDGREVVAALLVDDAGSQLERRARCEARLEVRADHVADRRGRPECLAPVPGDVADHDADATLVDREDVIEVAAGRQSLGGPVRNRDAERAQVVGHVGKQRRLEHADLLGERGTLAAQPPVAQDAGGDQQRG